MRRPRSLCLDPQTLMEIDPAAFWTWCRAAWTESPTLFERHLRSLDEMALSDLIELQTEGRTSFSGSTERLFHRFLETRAEGPQSQSPAS